MTNKPKLPDAKDWEAREIEDWNVLTFTEYLKALHLKLFDIEYAPFGGGWRKEQGDLGALIGTRSPKNPKPRVASNAMVKRFIDETMTEYQPSAKYPGTSFGFMWTYRKNVWQQIQAEAVREKKSDQAVQDSASLEDLAGWL